MPVPLLWMLIYFYCYYLMGSIILPENNWIRLETTPHSQANYWKIRGRGRKITQNPGKSRLTSGKSRQKLGKSGQNEELNYFSNQKYLGDLVIFVRIQTISGGTPKLTGVLNGSVESSLESVVPERVKGNLRARVSVVLRRLVNELDRLRQNKYGFAWQKC